MKKEKVEKREKNRFIIGFFKNLVAPAEVELTQEEIIDNSEELTQEQKDILKQCLADTEKSAHEMFAENIKAAKRTRIPRKLEEKTISYVQENTVKKEGLEREREQ